MKIKRWLLLLILLLLFGCSNATLTDTSNYYIVSFDVLGGSEVASESIVPGQQVTEPSIPTKEGYEFEGWYTSLTYETSYVFTNQVDQSFTLYAKWDLLSYTIFLGDADGVLFEEFIIPYGSSLQDIVLSAPLKIGYDFVSWSDALPLTMPSHPIYLEAEYSLIETNPQTISIEDETIIQVSSNGYAVFLLTSSGELYAFGKEGVPGLLCGVISEEADTLYLQNVTDSFPLEESEVIIQVEMVSYGDYYLLTNKGRVFTWGTCNECALANCASSDELGGIKDITDDFDLYAGEKITSLSHFEQLYALTDFHRVFGLGYESDDFQEALGLTPSEKPFNLTPYLNLNSNETVEKIITSQNYAVIITSTNRILMFGSNYNGTLGDGTTTTQELPVDITSNFNLLANETIKEVNLGTTSAVFLTSTGRVFITGYISPSNPYNGEENNYLPLDITNDFDLVNGITINHVYLVARSIFFETNTGVLYALGSNSQNHVIDNDESYLETITNVTAYYNLPNKEINYVFSLYSFTFIVYQDGTLALFGDKTFYVE